MLGSGRCCGKIYRLLLGRLTDHLWEDLQAFAGKHGRSRPSSRTDRGSTGPCIQLLDSGATFRNLGVGQELLAQRTGTIGLADHGQGGDQPPPDREQQRGVELVVRPAIAARIPFGWVAADTAYGDNGPLRAFLQDEGLACVLAVARDHIIAAPAGRRRADALARAAEAGRPSWRSTCATRPARSRYPPWSRSRARAERRGVLQAAKNEASLDHYQVRLYQGTQAEGVVVGEDVQAA